MTEHSEFRTLSARLGADPLQVQGPGGNTSLKSGRTMWIKASGTELADAKTQDIFVEVDLTIARAEAHGEGDGTCRAAVIDHNQKLRPSIETTFHALLDWPVVVHTHSIATLAHVTSREGRIVADQKLANLPFARVPYAKPGLPLTREIAKRTTGETRVFLLENHGLICCGSTVAGTSDLIDEVERRLEMPVSARPRTATGQAPEGFHWSNASWIAHDDLAAARTLGGSYYPDHVVFLGPSLPTRDDGDVPSIFVPDQGVALRNEATSSQRAMLQCLSDVLARVPNDWEVVPIGDEAEAELLDWDAEKYRQALAARS